MKLKKFQLKNGLNVLLAESRKSPVVSVQMWVNTGSADEKKGEEGISHFIEHLLFKGTEKYKVGEIASTVEGSSGELNAYTSFDNTVFYVTISKHYEDVALDVVYQMMGHPLFDKDEINNERGVVIEEIKRGNDNPHSQSSHLLFSTAFSKHPYGIPVIGYDKIIRKVTRAQIERYYHSRYVPRNMTLVVVGDFESQQMKKKIEQLYMGMESFPLKKVIRKKEAAQKSPKVAQKKSTFQEAYFTLSWKIPPVEHKDVPALDVLAMILGSGESSRLNNRLRNETGVVLATGCGAYTPRDSGLFYVTHVLLAEKLAEALGETTKILNDAWKILPRADEFQKAIRALEAEEYFSLETVDGIANKIGSFETLLKDPNYFVKYLSQIKKLKGSDIQRVAKKYLNPTAASITYLSPQANKKSEKEINKFLSEMKKKYKSKEKIQQKKEKVVKGESIQWKPRATNQNGEIKKVILTNGVEVLLQQQHETPTVSVQVAMGGGSRAEEASVAGVANLFSNCWITGLKGISEFELNHKIETLGARISSYSGKNSWGLKMSTLSPILESSTDLFLKILLQPEIKEETVAREKKMQLDAIRHIKDSPSQYAGQIFLKNLFGNHPYGRPVEGFEKTLEALTQSDMQNYYQQRAQAKNLIFSVCGSFSEEKVLKQIEQATKNLTMGERYQKTFEHKGLAKETLVKEFLQKEQAHVFIGYKGLTFQDPRRYALEIMQAVLAGQGGRLFLELRDKASLAYTVSPMRMEGIDTGYFGAYIGCSPEKVETAIEKLKIEFNKLCTKEIGSAEMERAKRYIIGRHDIDLQRNSALATSVLFDELYGLGHAETFHFVEKIKPIQAKEVKKLAEEIFMQQAPLITIVGPNKK